MSLTAQGVIWKEGLKDEVPFKPRSERCTRVSLTLRVGRRGYIVERAYSKENLLNMCEDPEEGENVTSSRQ